MHTDYVKALAYARNKGFVASAGLDKDVYIWDMEASKLPVSSSPGAFTSTKIVHALSYENIYSLKISSLLWSNNALANIFVFSSCDALGLPMA